MKLTANEKLLLRALVENSAANSHACAYVEDLLHVLPKGTFGGVLSSLIKKGAIETHAVKPRHGVWEIVSLGLPPDLLWAMCQ